MTSSAAVRLIAGREIRERMRGRSFKISTVVSSVVIVLVIILPTLRESGGPPAYEVAIAGPARSDVVASIEAAGDQVGAVLRVQVADDGRAATAQVRSGEADIGVLEREIVVDRALDPRGTGSVERVVGAIAETMRVRQALEREDVDTRVAAAILSSPGPTVRSLATARTDSSEQAVGFIAIIALFAFLQQYGSWVAYGVAEEKSTRIVEVLLSTVRPRDLLNGKVAGIGAVALTQGSIVAATAIVALEVAGDGVPANIDALDILVPLGWFLLGYAFYCWAFASAAALVGKQSDLQATMFPVMLPLIIAYFVSITASFGGDPSIVAKVLAYAPPTAPMLMLTLSAGGHVQTWQVALSAGITIVATVLLARLAARIYARSILRTGKRLKWGEALRTRTA